MMLLRPILFAVPLAMMPFVALSEATDDGARNIAAAFDRYTGGLDGLITVAPQGASYRITMDANAGLASLVSAVERAVPEKDDGAVLAAMLEQIKVDPLFLDVTEKGGGRWDVNLKQDWRLSVELDGQGSLTMLAPMSMAGVWDESILSFSHSQSTLTDTVVDQVVVGDDGEKLYASKTTEARTVSTSSSVPDGAGGVDSDTQSHSEGYKQAISFFYGEPDARGRRSVFGATYAVDQQSSKVVTKGLRVRQIMDLWAWLVAHPNGDEIIPRQDELREMLRTALPIFSSLDVDGAIEGMRFDTAIASAGLQRLKAQVALNGLVHDGRARVAIQAEGFTPPTLLMAEPWAIGLIPERVAFDTSVSGFDPKALADLVLDRTDLSAEDAFAGLRSETTLAALLPSGMVHLDVDHGEIIGKGYSVSWFGNFDLGPDREPSGGLRIEAEGLDKVEADLANASSPNAAEALEKLRTWREAAERRDGRDIWTFDVAEMAAMTDEASDE